MFDISEPYSEQIHCHPRNSLTTFLLAYMQNSFLALLSLVVVTIVAACSSSSSPADPANGTVKATIEGDAFNATLVTSATHTSGVLAIAGSDSRGRQIQLRIIGADKPGTYSLGGITNPNIATVTLAPESSQTYVTSMVGGSGTIVLTELSTTRAAGTFTFTAMNSATVQKKVTDGSFNLTLSK